MYIRPFATGALTFVPGVAKLLQKKTGGTNSALYCYGVWLKHLVMLWENGMRSIPDTLVELGPGDSLGVGLAAMLSGVNHYYALDVIEHSNSAANLAVFAELVTLFQRRAPRTSKGWPDYDAYLDDKLFPSHILTDRVLDRALSAERIRFIRNALLNSGAPPTGDISIRYMVPWSDANVIVKEAVEVIISHAVLQSVADLEGTYAALQAWLKPGGYMSHQIDFSCFRTAPQWNGHWAYSERAWKAIVGKRAYLINRQPYSVHAALVQQNGFEIISDLKSHRRGEGIERSQLAPPWKNLSDDDLNCSGAFIQAHKP